MLPRNLKTAPGADETTLAYITPEEQAILGLLNPGTPHIVVQNNVPTYDSVQIMDPMFQVTDAQDVTSGATFRQSSVTRKRSKIGGRKTIWTDKKG